MIKSCMDKSQFQCLAQRCYRVHILALTAARMLPPDANIESAYLLSVLKLTHPPPFVSPRQDQIENKVEPVSEY